jgi:tetratricopeptide (TPR) repeat protein
MENFTTDNLLNKALEFKDKNNDLDLALKYAYLAASTTYSPRADICATIGEIYLMKGNLHWAKFWYERALNNISVGINEQMVDPDYYTVIPMLKLCFINHKMGNDEAAKEMNDAVLLISPNNEIALSNKAQFIGK